MAILIISNPIVAQQNAGSLWDQIELTGNEAKVLKKQRSAYWWIWPVVGAVAAGGILTAILLLDKEDDPKNDAIETASDTIILNCHGDGSINVLDNDEAGLTLTDVNANNIEFSADGNIIFDNYLGLNNTIAYTVEDNNGQTAQETLAVSIQSGGNLHATDDSAITLYNTPVSLSALLNDTGDNISITSVSVPTGGGTVIQNGNSLIYTPQQGYFGTDSFNYTIIDDCNHTDTATVEIIVNAPPDITANDDTAYADCYSPLTLNVLENDEGEGINVTQVFPPANINVNIDGNGNLQIAGIGNTPFEFDYVIANSFGLYDTATVFVNILLPDIDIQNDTVSTNFGTSISISPLLNDNGEGLSITSWTNPPNGSLVNSINNSFIFTPDTNFASTASFDYTAQDDCRQEITATVVIIVGSIAVAQAEDDAVSGACLTSLVINPLGNDSGTGIEITSVSASGAQQVSITDATALFVSNLGSAPFTISYTITDDYGNTDTAIINVNVQSSSINAMDDDYSFFTGAAYNFAPLTNDVGNGLSIYSFTQPLNGTVAAGFDNQMVFNPPAGFTGTVSFTYTILDNCEQQDSATITLIVNSAPALIANNDNFTIICGESFSADILANDVGEGIYITNLSAPPGIILLQNPDNTISVSGVGNSSFSFSYSIADQSAQSASATVSVSVVVSALQAVNDSYTVLTGQSLQIEPLLNDSGAGLQLLNYTTPIPEGQVANSGNNTLLFTAPVSPGTVTFIYAVSDECGQLASGVVTIVVIQQSVVIAQPDSYSVLCNTPLTLTPLENDNGTGLSITDVSSLGPGITATIENGNLILLSGISSESFSFNYTITDGTSSSTAPITINVITSPITAVDDDAATIVDAPVSINPLYNDSGSGIYIYSIQQPLQGGSVSQNENTLIFTPLMGFSGNAVFLYTIADACGQTASAIITIEVTNTIIPLVLGNDTFTLSCHPDQDLYVFANDSGLDMQITNISAPAGINVSDAGNGFIHLQTSSIGNFSFTYTVTDNYGQSAMATVSISVIAPALIAVNDNLTTPFNTGIQIDPLTNDTGSGLSILSISEINNGGTLALLSGNTYLFTPATDHGGIYTFSYSVIDACGQTSNAVITINVGSPPPVNAVNDSVNVSCNSTASIAILNNDTGTGITITDINAPVGIVAIFNGVLLNISGIGMADFTISYTITDTYGQTDSAIINVNVSTSLISANDDADPLLTTPSTQNIGFNPTLNDAGIGLHIISFSQALGGTVTQDGELLVFDPDTDFAGNYVFTYTIEDACGQTDTGTITIIVTPGVLDFDYVVQVLAGDCGFTNTSATITSITPPGDYSILWGNGQTGLSASGMGDEVVVTVTDNDTGYSITRTIGVFMQPLDLIADVNIYCTTLGNLNVVTTNLYPGNIIWQFNNADGPISGIVAPGEAFSIQVATDGPFTLSLYNEIAGPSCADILFGSMDSAGMGLPIQIIDSELPSDINVQDGFVTMVVSDSVGSSWTWNVNGVITTTTVNTFTIYNLGFNIDYNITVTNNFGCEGSLGFYIEPGLAQLPSIHTYTERETLRQEEGFEWPLMTDPLLRDEVNKNIALPTMAPIETVYGTVYVIPDQVTIVPALLTPVNEISWQINQNWALQGGVLPYAGAITIPSGGTALLHYQGMASKLEGRYYGGPQHRFFAALGLTYNKLSYQIPVADFNGSGSRIGHYLKAGYRWPLGGGISLEGLVRYGWHYDQKQWQIPALDLRIYRRFH